MDKLILYRKYIQDFINEYAGYKPSVGEIENKVIFDTEKDHYQLLTVGWNNLNRIHGSILHVDIRGGKIWVQYDGTEESIALRLVKQGVPREDIVLAFHAPYKRPDTGFAVG